MQFDYASKQVDINLIVENQRLFVYHLMYLFYKIFSHYYLKICVTYVKDYRTIKRH
jgi:hypothetical protein